MLLRQAGALALLGMLLTGCGGGDNKNDAPNGGNTQSPGGSATPGSPAPGTPSPGTPTPGTPTPGTPTPGTPTPGTPGTPGTPTPEPPAPADLPASDADAARFLTQTTFGATRADIAYLRKIGYSKWIDEQMNPATTPVTLIEPHIRSIAVEPLNYAERRNYWLWKAVTSKDQLRMRMAFALSEIFVVSDRDYSKQQFPRIANYQDMLAQNAFGNYRTTLEKVTLHPAMALYLSYMANQKAFSYKNSQGQTISGVPDENYAREVMQLFSIGLSERNPDFSLRTDANGKAVPTYDQAVVASMARVFTGWTWNGNTDSSFWKWGIDGEARPLTCVPKYHDDKPKTIFRGIVIDAGNDCKASLARTLDALATHPNVAPFIGRQLIQRFVTSNPTPAYVGRISRVWTDSNGDFGKVLKAILLDPEARNKPVDAGYGKAREPLLQLTAFWRAFNAKYTPRDDGQYYFSMNTAWDFSIPLGQDTLHSPSVFNFFEPDYRLPSDGNALGLYAPEFQLYNEASFISIFNQQYDATNNAPGKVWSWTRAPSLDMAALLALANADNHAGMVDEIDTILFAGTLSAETRQVMVTMLDKLKQAKRNAEERTSSLVQLALATPEFVIQR